jgi:hypothetical protein
MTPNHHLASVLRAIVLLLVLTACGIPTTPRVDGLRLSLEVSPGTVVEGGEVDVTLTMRNDGPQTVQLSGASTCPPFGFRIVGSEQQPHADPTLLRICTADIRSWRVEPGRSLVQTFRWNGSIHSDGRQVRLPPGTYLLEGIVISPGDGRVTSSSVPLVIAAGAGTQ